MQKLLYDIELGKIKKRTSVFSKLKNADWLVQNHGEALRHQSSNFVKIKKHLFRLYSLDSKTHFR